MKSVITSVRFIQTIIRKPILSTTIQQIASMNDNATFSKLHKPHAFPWFGLDIGATLVKLVYFEPLDLTPIECELEGPTLSMIRRYLISNRSYGSHGTRDTRLELQNVKIRNRRGNLHFIRFPTHLMDNFLKMCVNHNFHKLTLDAYVTGGGAYKFENTIEKVIHVAY
ncbi:hypothetical protein GJ496_006576 [Pomphorhynchus laevis]|nr:hypothetical protein GJ496_006576 [Pomphorhynchus laevis]